MVYEGLASNESQNLLPLELERMCGNTTFFTITHRMMSKMRLLKRGPSVVSETWNGQFLLMKPVGKERDELPTDGRIPTLNLE